MLHTARLTLRPFRDADLPLFAAMNADPVVMRWLGGPRSAATTDAEVAEAARTWAVGRYGKLAVERRADGAFLGMCGLSREVWYPDDLELGWRLRTDFWGQGYATEAAQAWLAYAFDTLGARRVISIADLPNSRSIAVMKRIGMRWDHDATLDDNGQPFDAAIYALSAGEHAAVG